MSIILVDSYGVENYSGSKAYVSNLEYHGYGQTFAGADGILSMVKFYFDKWGSPSGDMHAKIYAITGTSGIDGVPTGSPLAISDAISGLDAPVSIGLVSFYFSGANQITLEAGTDYAVVLEYSGGNYSNDIEVGRDSAAPSHGGNTVVLENNDTWSYDIAYDVIFYVYTSETHPFISGNQVSYTMQTNLSYLTYYWRVRGKDPSGTGRYGAWSEIRSITIAPLSNKSLIILQAIHRSNYY